MEYVGNTIIGKAPVQKKFRIWNQRGSQTAGGHVTEPEITDNRSAQRFIDAVCTCSAHKADYIFN